MYNSYTYQLDQIMENNNCNSIGLDKDLYSDVRRMVLQLNEYTIRHRDHKIASLLNSDSSFIPHINSAFWHEITARVCVQGLLVQGDNLTKFTDTCVLKCHLPHHYNLTKHAFSESHRKAILSPCDMLEIVVQNHILHPSLENKVMNLLNKVQNASLCTPMTANDMECLVIFNSHTRPLANYAIFGEKCFDISEDELYGFFKPDANAGTGYNSEIICEWVTQRRREISICTCSQYPTKRNWSFKTETQCLQWDMFCRCQPI